MKTFAVLAVLLVGASAVSKEFVNKVMEEVQEVGMTCAEKEKATADEIQELMEHKIPPTGHGAKCVLACFYEHYDILTADGKMDKAAAIKSFDPLKNEDAEIYEKVLKVIDTCFDKITPLDDRCETGSALVVCAKTEGKALGLSKESFMGAA